MYFSNRVNSLILLLLVIFALPVRALDTPDGLNIFPPYSPVTNSISGTTPASAKLIGVGSVAEGGDSLSLKIQLDSPANPADL